MAYLPARRTLAQTATARRARSRFYDSHDLVCFNPKLIKLESDAGIRRSTLLAAWEPDLLADSFDEDFALRRLLPP